MIADLTSLSSDAILKVIMVKELFQGLLKEFFEISKQKNIPVVIDPKGKDYSIYSGAFLITPNYKEACEALSLDDTKIFPEELGRQLQKNISLQISLLL